MTPAARYPGILEVKGVRDPNETAYEPRARDARLRLAIEAAGMVEWDLDLTTGAIASSPRLAELFGYPPGQLLTWDDLRARHHPEDAELVQRATEEALAASQPLVAYEYRIVRPDGEIRWVQARGELFRDARGRAVRATGILMDVTARKRTERQLAESEARFRAVLTGSPIFLYEMDTELRYRWVCNPPPPLAPDEWIGRRDDVTSPPERAIPRMRLKQQVLETGRGLRAEVTHDTGSDVRTYDLTLEPVHDARGRVVGLTGAALDITERKRFEAALQRSEEQRRLALEAAALGVWDLDLTSGVLTVDDSFRELFGFRPGEAVTPEAVWGRVQAEDVPRLQAAIAQGKDPTGDGAYEAEYRVVLPDGTRRWHVSRAQVHFAGTGAARHPVRFVGVVMDRTERKHAEAALRESEERLRLAVEGGRLGTWELDLRTGQRIWSARAAAIYGVPGEEVGGYEGWLLLLHPDDRDRVREAFAAAVDGITPTFDAEFRTRHPDGRWRWAASHGLVLRDEAGRPLRALGVVQDVTERRRAEAALRDSEARFRTIVEDQTEFISRFSPDFTLTFVNQAYATQLGRPREDLIGTSILALMTAEQQARFKAQLATLTPEAPTVSYEMDTILPDGSPGWEQWTDRALFDANGRIAEYQSVGRDITGRKLTEEQQRLLLAELSHRVKNTLAVVQGIAARSLSGDRTLEEGREVLGKRLRALAGAHDLLTASEWRGAGLRAVLAAELKPYGSRAAFAGPEVELTPKAALTMALVLHELATNAVKYGALSKADGRLEVSWAVEDLDGGEPRLGLRWREHDGPPVTEPLRRGFGRMLIEQGFRHELGGEVTLEFRPDGLACELTVPTAAALARP